MRVNGRMSRTIAGVMLALLCSACVTAPTKSKSDSPRTVVDSYFAAINRRDLLALTAYVTPDFQWLSMVKGERFVEVESREALAQSLRANFDRHEFYRWTVLDYQTLGSTVAVTEKSEWREEGKPQSRTTVGVFELQGGRICRVTYFLE